jgi:hypothetical protein
VTPARAREMWRQRKADYGPSGLPPESLERMRELGRRIGGRVQTHCRAGLHRLDGKNLGADGRCLACRRQWKRHETVDHVEALLAAQDAARRRLRWNVGA